MHKTCRKWEAWGFSVSRDLLNLNKGVVILPRVSTAARDGLTPVNWMILYNSTTGRVQAHESGAWVDL